MKEWEDLANAIVVQACRDYEEEYYRADVERFLTGEWFTALTNLDGKLLLKELKKRVVDKELMNEEKKKGIDKIRQKRGY